LELHDVLGESASLVAEDVVDHAKFLVQAGLLDFGRQVSIDIIYHDIIRNEEGLNEVDHFERHEE